MCRKCCVLAIGIAAFGAGLLVGCLIGPLFLRILLGIIFFAIGIALLV